MEIEQGITVAGAVRQWAARTGHDPEALLSDLEEAWPAGHLEATGPALVELQVLLLALSLLKTKLKLMPGSSSLQSRTVREELSQAIRDFFPDSDMASGVEGAVSAAARSRLGSDQLDARDFETKEEVWPQLALAVGQVINQIELKAGGPGRN